MSNPDTKLWRDDKFIANDWRHLEVDDGEGNVIIPLSSWLGQSAEQRKAGSNRIGVSLLPGDQLEYIVADLAMIPLIALAFPAYTDGRSHSKAALLKSRHNYQGEVRAVGDVLVDQIPLLVRNGFDTLEVTNKVAQERLAAGTKTAVDVFYQPAIDKTKPTKGYSWRRLPAA